MRTDEWIRPTSSLQYVALKVSRGEEIEHAIDWMRLNGSSLCMNWGEDNDCWEVSWITGGVRFTGVSKELNRAILESLNKAFVKYGTPESAERQYAREYRP